MTAMEEQTLAGGKNFENAFGAIQTGQLEILLHIFRRYKVVKAELEAKNVLLFCSLLLSHL